MTDDTTFLWRTEWLKFAKPLHLTNGDMYRLTSTQQMVARGGIRWTTSEKIAPGCQARIFFVLRRMSGLKRPNHLPLQC